MTAKLYSGTLRHARYSPKKHAFSYKVFMPFVELETLAELINQKARPMPFLLSAFLLFSLNMLELSKLSSNIDHFQRS